MRKGNANKYLNKYKEFYLTSIEIGSYYIPLLKYKDDSADTTSIERARRIDYSRNLTILFYSISLLLIIIQVRVGGFGIQTGEINIWIMKKVMTLITAFVL